MVDDELLSDEPSVSTVGKVGFDARLQYYDVLKKFMLHQKLSALTGDLSMWYRGLNILFNMVYAYINEKDRALIEERLLRLESSLRAYNGGTNNYTQRLMIQRRIEKELLSIERLIHMAARTLFLPVKEETIGGFDDSEFLSRSDA